MSIIMLKNKRIAFPVFGAPQSIGEGEAAWGGRLIIDPDDPQVKELDAIIQSVARAKWKDDADSILENLKEKGKVAFQHGPYKNSNTGKVYAGFEGKFNLGMRWGVGKAGRPSVISKTGVELTENADRERAIYSGCYINAKVEFWAQDNTYGKRINCTPLGVMFAGDGDSFGGGASAAAASDFEEFVGGEDLV